MKMTDVSEAFQDLEQHIKECDYRYNKLEDKMDHIDHRLSRIEQLILEIRQALKH